MKGFGEHTSHFFKKTIINGNKSFKIYKILEFWIILVLILQKFYGAEDEEWR